MNFLYKKMFRSIKQFKFQFITVLLLAVLSVTVYSGLEGIWNGIKYEYNKTVKSTNLADEWIMATYFTEDDISAIKNLDGVTDMSACIRISAISKNKDGRDSVLSLDTVGNEAISSVTVMKGVGYNRSFTNSIWLDTDYAAENSISVGDVIPISYAGNTAQATVAGIVISTERAHFVGTADYYLPDHEKFGYGYISDDLTGALGVQIPCNILKLKSHGSAVKENVNTILGERFIAYYDRDTLFDTYFVTNQADNLKKVSILFSSLFILLAVLSMYTTIKRLIDAQSFDITTLKSLGFPNRSLILHYSMYGLLVSVIGTAIGFLCSYPFSMLVQKNQKELISLPKWPIKHTYGSLIIILLIIVLSLLTSVFAAWKAMAGLPAESLQKKMTRGKHLLFERAGLLWKKLGFGMRWTLRDAGAHKVRILLGIISVCGSFMLLMVGFGTPDSISSFTDKSYDEEFIYSYKYTLNSANTPEDIASLGQQTDGQFIETVQSRVNLEGSDETYFKTITVFTEGNYINLKTVDGERLVGSGAYITEGMAEALEVEKGDTVTLQPSFSGDTFTFKIAGIIPSSMPQTLYISESCWTSAGAAFRPTHLLAGDDLNPEVLRGDTRISQMITGLEQKNNLSNFKVKFSGIFNLMKFIAIILVVIVLYNLSILSFLERTRQYNTFRVLGFHYNEIRVLASFENLIILIFGSVAGLFLGFKFLELYCATFSNDTIKIYSYLTGKNLSLICCIVFFCTVITTFLLSLRIKKIDMVKALKE